MIMKLLVEYIFQKEIIQFKQSLQKCSKEEQIIKRQEIHVKIFIN